jgi:PAS domain-containing protein
MQPLVDKDQSVLRVACSSLEILVILRVEPGRFRSVGGIPDWVYRIFEVDDLTSDEFQPAKRSFFLQNFLIDAEEFWKCGATGKFSSGPWAEPDRSGNDLILEAIAVNAEDCPLLLIQSPKIYGAQRTLIQLARENALKYDLLKKTQESLRKSEARINAILEMIPDWIFLLDRDHFCVDLKQAKGYERSADFTPFLGRRFQELFPAKMEAAISSCFALAQETDAVQSLQLDLFSEKGTSHYDCRFIARGEGQFLAILRLI